VLATWNGLLIDQVRIIISMPMGENNHSKMMFIRLKRWRQGEREGEGRKKNEEKKKISTKLHVHTCLLACLCHSIFFSLLFSLFSSSSASSSSSSLSFRFHLMIRMSIWLVTTNHRNFSFVRSRFWNNSTKNKEKKQDLLEIQEQTDKQTKIP